MSDVLPKERMIWDVFTEHERKIKALCAFMAKGNELLNAELYSEAAVRIGGIVGTYDEAKGAMSTHITANLRWYFYKYLKRAWRKDASIEVDIPVIANTLAEIQVNDILEQLPPIDAMLLSMRYIEGMAYTEMGALLGHSRVELSERCEAALQKARRLDAKR